MTTALARFGMAGTTQQPGDDLLALGAREAVARIRSGDITAEAYFTQLLKQYYAHKDLNVANAIDGARVLEAARGFWCKNSLTIQDIVEYQSYKPL